MLFQCRNVGSDGFDVQWECKAEMDDSYRFGKIQVSCEGYDYPNDPYVLKGNTWCKVLIRIYPRISPPQWHRFLFMFQIPI